jgi:hypothetical protein
LLVEFSNISVNYIGWVQEYHCKYCQQYLQWYCWTHPTIFTMILLNSTNIIYNDIPELNQQNLHIILVEFRNISVSFVGWVQEYQCKFCWLSSGILVYILLVEFSKIFTMIFLNSTNIIYNDIPELNQQIYNDIPELNQYNLHWYSWTQPTKFTLIFLNSTNIIYTDIAEHKV